MMPPHYFFFVGLIGIDVTGTAPLQKGAIPPTAKRQEIGRVGAAGHVFDFQLFLGGWVGA